MVSGFMRNRPKAWGRIFWIRSSRILILWVISAGIHPIHCGKYHRLSSKRFPFAVCYRVEDQTARVYAVLDCRRSPAWIRKELGTSTWETTRRSGILNLNSEVENL